MPPGQKPCRHSPCRRTGTCCTDQWQAADPHTRPGRGRYSDHWIPHTSWWTCTQALTGRTVKKIITVPSRLIILSWSKRESHTCKKGRSSSSCFVFCCWVHVVFIRVVRQFWARHCRHCIWKPTVPMDRWQKISTVLIQSDVELTDSAASARTVLVILNTQESQQTGQHEQHAADTPIQSDPVCDFSRSPIRPGKYGNATNRPQNRGHTPFRKTRFLQAAMKRHALWTDVSRHCLWHHEIVWLHKDIAHQLTKKARPWNCRCKQLPRHLAAGKLHRFPDQRRWAAVATGCGRPDPKAGTRTRDLPKRTRLAAEGEWGKSLHASARSLSLFNEKRLLELDLRGAKMAVTNLRFLQAHAEQPPTDTLLLVFCDRLEAKTEQAAWLFAPLKKYGTVITVWPISREKIYSMDSAACCCYQLTLSRTMPVFNRTDGGQSAGCGQALEKLALWLWRK